MKIESLINVIEATMFRKRILVLSAFVLASIFLVFQASQIKLDAAFTKHIPLNHTYMKTYLEYRENFGGANNVLISVCDKEGDIFNEPFFNALKGVHDQLFFIPGVDRIQVKSLFSPSTRFVEIVEDGFAGGPVIPANFKPDTQGLSIVKSNIEKAGIVGRIVADDYSCAMVKASLMDTDPQTGERLDTLVIAQQLEEQIRGKFEHNNISIHIIGFSKMVGDVAEGAKGVVAFFAIAIVITTLMVFWFCRSISLTILPIACSLVAVVWQLGLLRVKPLNQTNARLFKLCTHRWIYIAVATGYLMPQILSQLGQAAHKSAADTKDMNMHFAVCLSAFCLRCCCACRAGAGAYFKDINIA